MNKFAKHFRSVTTTAWFRRVTDIVVLSLFFVVTPWIVEGQVAPMTEQERLERIRRIDAPFKTLEYARSLLRPCPPERFVEVSFRDVPRKIRSQVYSKLGFLLRREAHPQQQPTLQAIDGVCPGVEIRVIASFDASEVDLVEYRWQYLGQKLRALFRRDMVQIDIQLEEADSNPNLDEYGVTEIERVKGFVEESLVRMEGETATLERYPYELKIPWPSELSDGVRFSSNPDMSLRSMDVYFWFRRVDWFVENRTLSLLFYTKPGQLVGYPNGSKWFPDDFRVMIHERARAEGKLPPPSESETP